jgi:hypothetical protein
VLVAMQQKRLRSLAWGCVCIVLLMGLVCQLHAESHHHDAAAHHHDDMASNAFDKMACMAAVLPAIYVSPVPLILPYEGHAQAPTPLVPAFELDIPPRTLS